jgi:UDP-glucose 4-epimerase
VLHAIQLAGRNTGKRAQAAGAKIRVLDADGPERQESKRENKRGARAMTVQWSEGEGGEWSDPREGVSAEGDRPAGVPEELGYGEGEGGQEARLGGEELSELEEEDFDELEDEGFEDEDDLDLEDYTLIAEITNEELFEEDALRELLETREHWPEWSILRMDAEERRDIKRAVVTGGAGFIGSHVAELLLDRGYRVIVADNLSSGLVENIPEGAIFERTDLTDESGMFNIVYQFAPHYIFHLAAQSSVMISVEHPLLDFYPNVGGTVNVLEAARTRNVPVIFASTGGALYGDEAPLPTNEEFPPDPLSPYGIGKRCCEIYAMSWNRLFKCQNTVLRLANVYGPRQSTHGEAGVVARFSSALQRSNRPRIFGDGEQTRDYIYVRDVAEAFIAAAESPSPGIYNVGTGIQTSVNALLELLQSVSGRRVPAEYMMERPGELRFSALDATRMRETFGWKPKMELEAGLKETFAYYADEPPTYEL